MVLPEWVRINACLIFLQLHGRHWALTICMENPVIPARIQMERFIPVELFRKKGNALRGITFSSLFPEFPEISVPFVNNTSARLLTAVFPRKWDQMIKWYGSFPFRLHDENQMIRLILVPFSRWEKVQFHLCNKINRKFHPNGKRSLFRRTVYFVLLIKSLWNVL